MTFDDNNTAFCTPLALSSATSFHVNQLNCPIQPSRRVSVSSRRPVVALVDLRDPDTKQKATDEAELQELTDPAPGPYAFFAEQVNGRAAMVGFTAALLIELTSGVTINNQIAMVASSTAKQGFLMFAPFIEILSRSLVN